MQVKGPGWGPGVGRTCQSLEKRTATPPACSVAVKEQAMRLPATQAQVPPALVCYAQCAPCCAARATQRALAGCLWGK